MERVLPDSQVGKWNASCGEEYTVEIGDRVIAVNGLRDTSAMQSEMAFARRLFLTVERRELVPQEERVEEKTPAVRQQWDVSVVLEPGDTLGIALDVDLNTVTAMGAGLIGAWNEKGLAPVRVGDRVVSVNGVRSNLTRELRTPGKSASLFI